MECVREHVGSAGPRHRHHIDMARPRYRPRHRHGHGTGTATAPHRHCTNGSCHGTDVARPRHRHTRPWHRHCTNVPCTGTDMAQPRRWHNHQHVWPQHWHGHGTTGHGVGASPGCHSPARGPKARVGAGAARGGGQSPKACAPPSAGVSVQLLLHRLQPVLPGPPSRDPEPGTRVRV